VKGRRKKEECEERRIRKKKKGRWGEKKEGWGEGEVNGQRRRKK